MYWEGVEWPEGWSFVPTNNPHSPFHSGVEYRHGTLHMEVLLLKTERVFRTITRNTAGKHPGRSYVGEFHTAEEALADCVKFILTEG